MVNGGARRNRPSQPPVIIKYDVPSGIAQQQQATGQGYGMPGQPAGYPQYPNPYQPQQAQFQGQLQHQQHPQGAMPHGHMPLGHMPQGHLPQGAMPHGHMPQGHMQQGSMHQGSMPQATMAQNGISQVAMHHNQMPQAPTPQPYQQWQGQYPQQQYQSQSPQGNGYYQPHNVEAHYQNQQQYAPPPPVYPASHPEPSPASQYQSVAGTVPRQSVAPSSSQARSESMQGSQRESVPMARTESQQSMNDSVSMASESEKEFDPEDLSQLDVPDWPGEHAGIGESPALPSVAFYLLLRIASPVPCRSAASKSFELGQFASLGASKL